MECPRESTLLDYLQANLDRDTRARLEGHLEVCADCRRVLAEGMLAADPMVGAVAPQLFEAFREAPALPQRGTTVAGRYEIRGRVGAGSMGVVYAAYDPNLDRKVALKLVHPSLASSEQVRMRHLREAQALARLSHPHVVAIYDAGLHEGSLFLAMEFIEGQTLRRWLAERPRTWREVAEVFLAAGRGLAAAHAAGLVHRDFKPDNVLVSKDRQVRVGDFGLARPAYADPSFSTLSSGDGSDVPPELAALTETGKVLGTPAYMAPELLKGAPADFRSDQYSFCVALHEALSGSRPQDGIPALGSRVPSWLRRVVERGLQRDAAERLPSMQVLVSTLARGLGRRRRGAVTMLAVAMVVVALLATAGAAAGYAGTRRAGSRLCSGAAQRLAGVWDAERRAAVRQAFEASGESFALSTLAVERSLDAYAAEWVRMQADACEATRIRGEQSEAQLGLRTACLDRRLQEFKVLTALFAQGDADVIERAPQAAASLEELSSCADLAALGERPPSPEDPALRAHLTQLESKVAQARALLKIGKMEDARSAAEAAVKELGAAGQTSALAEAQYLLGDIERQSGRYEAAERQLSEAIWSADQARDDELRARAWLRLLAALINEKDWREAVPPVLRHTRAAVARLREAFPSIEAELHERLAAVARLEARYADALEEDQRALMLRERAGASPLTLAESYVSLGQDLSRLLKFEEAAAYYRRALAVMGGVYPPDHPTVAKAWWRGGELLYQLGRGDEAAEALAKALAVWRRGAVQDSPTEASMLISLARVEALQGKLSQARLTAQRGAASLEQLGLRHRQQYAVVLRTLGELDLRGRAPRQALASFREALSLDEQEVGASPRKIIEDLTLTAQALLALGERREARSLLERAKSLQQQSVASPEERAQTDFALAQVLWPEPRERARSLKLAHEAQDAFKTSSPLFARDLAEVSGWLEARGGSPR